MNAIVRRRVQWSAGTAVLALAATVVVGQLNARLKDPAVGTGILLFVLMIALTLFNGRKKLPFLPLGAASTWLRFHSYAGLFSFVLFWLHAGFGWPRGGAETVLFFLYWAVALSGVGGLFLSRLLPKRLNQRGQNVTFEDIPRLRRELETKAKTTVLQALDKTKMSTLADFYAFRLAHFFSKPRNFWPHLMGLQFHMRKINTGLGGVRRYLNEEELVILAELERLTREKDDLDHQAALQLALKLWLFLHIPLTYGLLVFAAVHGVLAWKLTG